MAAGFLILLIAGLFQGSYGRGWKEYKPFSWAVFWGVFNILAILTSTVFAVVAAPNVFANLLENGAAYILRPILCGVVWGLSAICFSKGISMIGMSLVYGISMGVSTVSGALTPMLISGNFPDGTSLLMFLTGLVLTIVGVIVITEAGIRRDGKAKSSVIGIVLSVFSGLGSGIMNLGYTFTADLQETYASSVFAESAVRWLPVLIGGCLAGLLYCIGEVSVTRQWHTVIEEGAGKTTGKIFGTSIIWYLALILYGVSIASLGSLGDTVGWILFNSLALVVSVFWGIRDGEWKNKKKTLLAAGCIILIISWIFSSMS